MHKALTNSKKLRGLTIMELTLVMSVLVTFISTSMFFASGISDWQKGRTASETLREVYVAQRLYLADYPLASVAELTTDDLMPYLPSQPSSFPTVESLDKQALDIQVNVSPPVINGSGGGSYDPSKTTDDSLWDVGVY